MRLAEVIEARQHAVPQPSWAAIMTKAFALAAREHPQMRQAFLEFPWGHIGEFEYQVGTVVITRRVGNEDIVFFARLPEPEKRSLRELDDLIRFHQQVPLDKCGATRIVFAHCAAAAFAKPIFVVAGAARASCATGSTVRHLHGQHHGAVWDQKPGRAHRRQPRGALWGHQRGGGNARQPGHRSSHHGRRGCRFHAHGNGTGLALRDSGRITRHGPKSREWPRFVGRPRLLN